MTEALPKEAPGAYSNHADRIAADEGAEESPVPLLARCANDVTPFADARGKVSESGCDPTLVYDRLKNI